MGIWNLRAKFWSVPVMKAWVKKKPLIQNMVGGPLASNHFRRNSRRSRKSFTQPPRPLRDGYDTAPHMAGTLPMTMELPMASSSPDMTTSPFTARCTSLSCPTRC